MRENWTTEAETIRSELDRLKSRRTPLAFLHNSLPPRLTTIRATHQVQGLDLLIVGHEGADGPPSQECLFYYHPPGAPLRGFRCQPLRQVNGLLGLKFPGAIFTVERRQQPRQPAPPTAMAIFSLANRQLPVKCTVANLSPKGAGLRSRIPGNLRLGPTITPLTISLVGAGKTPAELRIQIEEATVVWTQPELAGEEGQVFGVAFRITDGERERLENYLAAQLLAKL